MFSTLAASTPWPEKPGSRSALGPCPGTATAMAVAELAKQQALLVVVVPSSASAAALERELPLFSAADLNVLTLPDWETLPYDLLLLERRKRMAAVTRRGFEALK